MTMEMVLIMIASLVAAFGSQVYLVKRLVAFAKEANGLQGATVRWLSFGIGAVVGAPILWTWITLNPGLPLPVYIMIGMFFELTAGLIASGDYDLKQDTAELE